MAVAVCAAADVDVEGHQQAAGDTEVKGYSARIPDTIVSQRRWARTVPGGAVSPTRSYDRLHIPLAANIKALHHWILKGDPAKAAHRAREAFHIAGILQRKLSLDTTVK